MKMGRADRLLGYVDRIFEAKQFDEQLDVQLSKRGLGIAPDTIQRQKAAAEAQSILEGLFLGYKRLAKLEILYSLLVIQWPLVLPW